MKVDPKKIKSLRMANNMTQEQLARKLQCSVSIVVKWEAGASQPGMLYYFGLCQIFNKVPPFVDEDTVRQMTLPVFSRKPRAGRLKNQQIELEQVASA